MVAVQYMLEVSSAWVKLKIFHEKCYRWYVAQFGISHFLAFAWLFERIQMHANAFFTFL